MTTRSIYVLDTSTLFNLGHRGRLEGLAEHLRAEADLWITPQVREEIKQEESVAYFQRCIRHLVEERTPTKSRFTLAEMHSMAEAIHQAEISAILLAAEHDATVSLDERLARKKAIELGVKTTGTLGLMRIGLDRGWMSDDECMAAVRRMRTGKGPSAVSVHFSSASDDWPTPQDFFDRMNALHGPLELDVCASPENAKCPRYYTREDDGLAQPWAGRCWMNPPYGRTIGLWMRKAYEESQRGALVVCLVPARTDTAWWHDYATKGQVTFIRGRLKFGGHRNSAPFPSATVVFLPNAERRHQGHNVPMAQGTAQAATHEHRGGPRTENLQDAAECRPMEGTLENLRRNRRCDGPPMGRIPSGERQAQQLTPRENAMTTNDDQKPKDTTEADSSAGVSCAAAAGSPSEAAVQYADYILNHYSRHSHKDKLCLARDLEESHGWTPNNDIVNLLRLYGWKAEESLQMFLHRMKANDQSEPHGLTTKL